MSVANRFDVAIVGSGFSGSILASILAKRGMRVAMIDSATHPRFSIGESSTPIANILLRKLGHTYDLPYLVSLSTWGSWQREHGDIACGCKRGFSYFAHQRGEHFAEQSPGDRSLLVAASSSDEVADTQWYRPEVDEFLFHQAIGHGVTALTGREVVAIEKVPGNLQRAVRLAHEPVSNTLRTNVATDDSEIEATWVIDASGRAGVTAKICGGRDLTDQMRSRTHSVYAHFSGVRRWTDDLRRRGCELSDDPFDADHAAQHHLLRDGWLWMLRFNNGITSVGYTTSLNRSLDCSGYPSIAAVMNGAIQISLGHAGEGFAGENWLSSAGSDGLRSSGRLQRLFDPVVSDRIVMLPTAAVTNDPLHSTGIAHSLAGVDRLADLVLEPNVDRQSSLLAHYRQAVCDEARLIDRLVHTAYESMHDFPRFTVACMLYFAAAIRCEERYQSGDTPGQLWNADAPKFVKFTNWACHLLCDPEVTEYNAPIRDRLCQWNTAGLMAPAVHNRYAYTAVKDRL